MRLPRLRELLVGGAVLLAAGVSIGGGATYVAMEVTAKPQFCTTCHIMQPYYDSWASSSHAHVPCIDCHYEPGLLETFEGKFKALSQLAKYVTATEGTKPWAEVSDLACMRAGCHSERLIEGEIRFGRIRFDHRQHLVGLRRGKRLRCTSCHSQIVQGSHLTVTKASCILCHFRASPDSKPIDDCRICHGPPQEEIHLGDFVFRHDDYLARGVECRDCHGDISRGTGDVPRERCGSCHNVQEHLERYEEVEFIHQNHVTDHSVPCLECHLEIEHSLPPREAHYQGDCRDCHSGTHGAVANVYRGTGGLDVPDRPSAMYLARVTCNGCHRPLFPDAPVPVEGATFAADPIACLGCHGAGYEGMTSRWQAEARAGTEQVKAAVQGLAGLLGEDASEEARGRYERAVHNLSLVLLDRSEGVHNLPYVRDLLRRASEDAREGYRLLGREDAFPRVRIGPHVESEQGCTDQCHVGVEDVEGLFRDRMPFPHEPHVLQVGFDCSECHLSEPHGRTVVEGTTCTECHHPDEDEDSCATCHADVGRLLRLEIEGVEENPMGDLDCLTCHEGVGDEHSVEAIQVLCNDCHEDDEEDFAARHYDDWKASATDPLREVERLLPGADAAVAPRVRRELRDLLRAGPWHNVPAAQAEAARLRALLETR